jgi:hypothetical protein
VPTNITDVSTFTAPIVTPASGDARTAASVAAPVQGLANRARWLVNQTRAGLTLSGIQIPLSAFVTDQETLANPDAWQYRVRFLVEHDKSANNKAVCEVGLWLPSGVAITQVQALAHGNIVGSGSHGTIASMTMPVLRFREMDTTGTVNFTDSQADTSADAASYEVNHPITLAVPNRVIDPLLRYMVIIDGEQGTNALNDRFGLKSLSISWTKATGAP